MNHYLDLILIPVQIIIVIYTIYYIVLAAFGMWRRKEKKNYTPKNTFAVIICAHNEEAVVGQLITVRIQQHKWPKPLVHKYIFGKIRWR